MSILIVFTLILSSIFPNILEATVEKKILVVPYMDQVIKRKTKIIYKKCLKSLAVSNTAKNIQGFMMIEVQILKTGKTNTRLIATEIKNQSFIICALSVLNRIKFKKLKPHPVTRIYRFFIS